jgi:hypothetical protein
MTCPPNRNLLCPRFAQCHSVYGQTFWLFIAAPGRGAESLNFALVRFSLVAHNLYCISFLSVGFSDTHLCSYWLPLIFITMDT